MLLVCDNEWNEMNLAKWMEWNEWPAKSNSKTINDWFVESNCLIDWFHCCILPAIGGLAAKMPMVGYVWFPFNWLIAFFVEFEFATQLLCCLHWPLRKHNTQLSFNHCCCNSIEWNNWSKPWPTKQLNPNNNNSINLLKLPHQFVHSAIKFNCCNHSLIGFHFANCWIKFITVIIVKTSLVFNTVITILNLLTIYPFHSSISHLLLLPLLFVASNELRQTKAKKCKQNNKLAIIEWMALFCF